MFTKVVCLLIHVVLPNLNGGSVCAFAAHTGHPLTSTQSCVALIQFLRTATTLYVIWVGGLCGTVATPQILLHLKFNHSTEYDEVVQQGLSRRKVLLGRDSRSPVALAGIMKVQGESL